MGIKGPDLKAVLPVKQSLYEEMATPSQFPVRVNGEQYRVYCHAGVSRRLKTHGDCSANNKAAADLPDKRIPGRVFRKRRENLPDPPGGCLDLDLTIEFTGATGLPVFR